MPEKNLILIVDDYPINRSILRDVLGDSYDFIEAEDGIEGIEMLEEHGSDISLVLLDLVMPKLDGFGVLEHMNKAGIINDVPVVMITSEPTSESFERAYNLGVTDFLQRPFDERVVRRRVENTIALYAKQEVLQSMVESQIAQRERSVNLMIAILSQIVEFRNGESSQHVLHVNMITERLLRQLASTQRFSNITEEDISGITLASSLHDIGKMSIPEEILNKPGRLTDEEFEIMKTHSAIGSEMLKTLPNFEDEPLIQTAYQICRWHHERYDGRGYPDGLAGDDIPLSAQVVALADVYDALTSKRVYKDAFSHDKAMEMIIGGECGQFNPVLLEALEAISDDIQKETLKTAISSKSEEEIRRIVANTTKESIKDAAPSERTLSMLEYERMKFNFFGMMSNEVQYEYTVDPSMMMIQDWGSVKLGLPETIADPYDSDELNEVFGEENIKLLFDALRASTPDNPIVQVGIQGSVDGEPRWFHVAARANWKETPDGYDYMGSIGKIVDISESRQRITELEQKATTDSLTGLTNHSYAQQLISSNLRENPDDYFLMMVLDMDHFKNANDEYGHMFGDEVLKEMGKRIRNSVRDDDIVSRVGGDEFLICMKAGPNSEALVKRVYNSLLGDYKQFPVCVSMGVVQVKGEDADYETLFKSADYYLTSMKRSGRGGYIFGEYGNFTDEDFKSAISIIESDDDHPELDVYRVSDQKEQEGASE